MQTTRTDIKTLMKLALPIGSQQYSGRPETPVHRVHHLRAHSPGMVDMAGGELVLLSTTALGTHRPKMPLETVIEQITESRASALGVQGAITPQAQQVARSRNFPLIALPEQAVLPQVGRAVERLLTNPQAQFAHRAFELQQTLQRHASGYQGLKTMLNALVRLLDRPAVIHDQRKHVVCRGFPATAHRVSPADEARLVHRLRVPDAGVAQDGHVIQTELGLTVLLVHEGSVVGYLTVLHGEQPPDDDFDVLALEYSAPTLARELAWQQSAAAESDVVPATRNWFADWLNGPPNDDALLTLRAEKDGFITGLWYAAVVFEWRPTAPYAPFSAAQMVSIIQAELRQRRIQALVGQVMDRVVLLFPLDEPQQTQRLKQVVDLLHAALVLAAPEGAVTAGLGRPEAGLTALRESVWQAGRALELAARLEEPVVYFGEASLYDLLDGVQAPALLEAFSDHWLTPLVTYDERHRTALVSTLAAYFAHNGNMARTAHVLNIHRNTLVYRLGRITEILQLDMDDADVRLNLQLALKIRRMM
jgi:PucR family transcriptional regulator, purine catabolism regulatory protein